MACGVLEPTVRGAFAGAGRTDGDGGGLGVGVGFSCVRAGVPSVR